MPIEVRRFGVGNRRPGGPPGSEGVSGQVIHNDARGIVSELAFERGGHIDPHSNPNTTWFIVIEGGVMTSITPVAVTVGFGVVTGAADQIAGDRATTLSRDGAARPPGGRPTHRRPSPSRSSPPTSAPA